MTKFEQIGVERQLESDTKAAALYNFKHSCKVCCYRGMKIDCDRCAIAFTNSEVVACFEEYIDQNKQNTSNGTIVDLKSVS